MIMHRSGPTMAWNVFKFCTALRGLGSIMIVLVLGVVAVTYYALVLNNYGPALNAGGIYSATAFAVLLLFHGLLVMLLWSYFSVVFTDPGGVPPNWRPEVDEERGDTAPLTGSEYGGAPISDPNQRIRYCRKCNHPKPPRCHHCSVCGRCILKMDHHCVWVVNCVGALNYKYFLLFLEALLLSLTLFGSHCPPLSTNAADDGCALSLLVILDGCVGCAQCYSKCSRKCCPTTLLDLPSSLLDMVDSPFIE